MARWLADFPGPSTWVDMTYAVLCTTEFRLKTRQDPYLTSEPFRQVCGLSEIIMLSQKNLHQDIAPSRYWIFGLERRRCWEFRSPPKGNTCTWNIECIRTEKSIHFHGRCKATQPGYSSFREQRFPNIWKTALGQTNKHSGAFTKTCWGGWNWWETGEGPMRNWGQKGAVSKSKHCEGRDLK